MLLVIEIWVIGDYLEFACLPQAGDLVIGILCCRVPTNGI
jgi:hypothetical protein